MSAMMTRLPYATIIPSGVAGTFPVALTVSEAGSVSAIVLELHKKNNWKKLRILTFVMLDAFTEIHDLMA